MHACLRHPVIAVFANPSPLARDSMLGFLVIARWLRRMTQAAPETLWSNNSETCTLEITESHYVVLLHHDGRLKCLLKVESEAAARTLAEQWRIKLNRRPLPIQPSAS